MQCLGQPYNNTLVESPGLGQCLHIHSKSSTHISCYDNMVTCVPVFTTYFAVKKIETWRGVEAKVGAGCPISGGMRWSSGFQAGRWGGSGDPVLSLVLVGPSRLPGVVPALSSAFTMMPPAKTLSHPLPMCQVFVTLSCPLAGSQGRWVEGGISLFLLMQSCVWQQCVVSAACSLVQAAQPAELAS